MKRIFMGVVFAMGVGTTASAANAQELALKQPKLSARATCSPSLQDRCSGVSQRGLNQDAACDSCASAPVMPADIASSPPHRMSAPSAPERPLECAVGLMPLGVTAPGCLRPPIDNVPLP
jgi:hypothetical protein